MIQARCRTLTVKADCIAEILDRMCENQSANGITFGTNTVRFVALQSRRPLFHGSLRKIYDAIIKRQRV